jgi:pimeloyl-ACP methyl ester carboxylesterase
MTVALLHDLGDPDGGARWRSAAPPDWIIPDLPGHGSTPASRTGHCDPMSAVAIARWTLARERHDTDASTLVGVGYNAHSALINAAGGDCDRVVIVDGLWGPWLSPAEEIDTFYAMIRAIAADPAATGPPPASGLDPRASYGYGVMSSARFAQRLWATVDHPLLAIETPRSTTPRDERRERIAWFGGETTLLQLDTANPATVVDAIRTWGSATD